MSLAISTISGMKRLISRSAISDCVASIWPRRAFFPDRVGELRQDQGWRNHAHVVPYELVCGGRLRFAYEPTNRDAGVDDDALHRSRSSRISAAASVCGPGGVRLCAHSAMASFSAVEEVAAASVTV